MSVFAVERRKIEKVWDHSNADRLSLAKVEGLSYQFVVQKGSQKEGDFVIFFPIDSLIPQDLIAHFGIGNMLAGKEKNRVKTVRLRNEISQGFVSNINSVLEYLEKKGQHFTTETLPFDLTELLQIQKYEPPVVIENSAKLTPLSGKIYSYDIEGDSRYPEIVENLKTKKVFITEKIEGQNFGITIWPDGSILVNQRNFFVEPIPEKGEHSFLKTAKTDYLYDKIKNIQSQKFPNKTVTLRGEFIGPGVQKNLYNKKDHTVLFYDMDVDGKPICVNEFISILKEFFLQSVPILAVDVVLSEWLNDKTIEMASTGESKLAPILREGIVVKPMMEEEIGGYGRLIFKHRSAEYLAKTDF